MRVERDYVIRLETGDEARVMIECLEQYLETPMHLLCDAAVIRSIYDRLSELRAED